MVEIRSPKAGVTRFFVPTIVGTLLLAAVGLGSWYYLRASSLPPLAVIGNLDLGEQPAWKPIHAKFSLSNPSQSPVTLERLVNF